MVAGHGNTLADLQANLALPRHQKIELADFLKAHKQQKSGLKPICMHLAAIEKLAHMAAIFKKQPRTKQAAHQPRAKARHVWAWQADRRVCLTCGMAPRRRHAPHAPANLMAFRAFIAHASCDAHNILPQGSSLFSARHVAGTAKIGSFSSANRAQDM
jgi:hypothetical protein